MSTGLFDQSTVLDGTGSASEQDAHSGGSTPVGMTAVHRGMEKEEAARARTIGLVFFFVCILTTIWAPFLAGHPALYLPLLVILGWFSFFSI